MCVCSRRLRTARRGRTAGRPDGTKPYFHKNLVHELSTIFLEQLALQKPGGGWTFHQAPAWFEQGLEEYLGCTLSGDSRRRARYVGAAVSDASRIDADFTVREVYSDGCARIACLFDTYGGERVLDLLECPAPDFWSAVHEVLEVTPEALFRIWSAWRVSQDGQ